MTSETTRDAAHHENGDVKSRTQRSVHQVHDAFQSCADGRRNAEPEAKCPPFFVATLIPDLFVQRRGKLRR